MSSHVAVSEGQTNWVNSSSASPNGSSTEPTSQDASPSTAIAARQRRRPIPRKGHTKSRRGCYNCKRRKVKCEETLPECGHCQRLGLVCEYPDAKAALIPEPAKALNSTPTTFSMEDLRFFQHFLFNCYPPLPIQGDAVWKDVAAISHSFDFLIHAMLGLAASHLSLCKTGEDYSSQALAHRVIAINSLNQSLNRPIASKAEGDARFATLMVLTFQSSYMDEGMNEFLSMVRGCYVVSETAMQQLEDSIFCNFSLQKHIDTVHQLHNDAPYQKQEDELVDDFATSISGLAPLCQSTLEIEFLAYLHKIIKAARDSAVDAFTELSVLYALFGSSNPEEFKTFSSATNYTAQILLAHFFLAEYMIGAIALHPVLASFPFRKSITLKWIRLIAGRLPASYEPFIRWPLRFAESLLDDEARRVNGVPSEWTKYLKYV